MKTLVTVMTFSILAFAETAGAEAPSVTFSCSGENVLVEGSVNDDGTVAWSVTTAGKQERYMGYSFGSSPKHVSSTDLGSDIEINDTTGVLVDREGREIALSCILR